MLGMRGWGAYSINMNVRHETRCAGVTTDPQRRHPHDFYATDPLAVKRLLEVEKFRGPIWEPAAGDGSIVRELRAAGHQVAATDLVKRAGGGMHGVDFLAARQLRAPNVVTNPPNKLQLEFMRHAIKLGAEKIAMFVRLASLAGGERGWLYRSDPFTRAWVFSERVQSYRGGLEAYQAERAADGRSEKISSMIDTIWLVWDRRGTPARHPINTAAGTPLLGFL